MATRLSAYLFVMLITGCATSYPPVPVENVRTGSSYYSSSVKTYSKNERIYTVKSGDTLYDIAYSSDMSVQQIINRNGLSQAHLIYPGQKLIINNTHKRSRKQSDSVIKTPFWARLGLSGYKSQKNNEKQIHRRDGNSRANRVLIELKWPAKGEVVKKFNQGQPPSKGIDISGRYGDPVYAASAGTVVYTGEGVRGYGKMVILLHENGYLTAYGNNRRIRVRDQQVVEAGEMIATIGTSASERSELHFEVRLNGRPVDPLRYLPSME